MNARPWLSGLACLAAVSLGHVRAEPGKDVSAQARAFVRLLAREDYDRAGKDFDETMRKAMPADKLKKAWKGLLDQVGAFQKQTGLRTEHSGKYDVVYVTCAFARTSLDVKVVFTAEQQIAGLFFVPTKKPPPPYQPPDYVRRDAFHDEEVTVGAAPWSLPATLSLPKGEGPFPGVVLVHGSGPQDRDERIGPNRPFRDLAEGLASRGIAVLRYDKRTHIHGARFAQLKSFTVKEEVVDDALAAARLLRQRKEINRKKVFVAGHSLGGMLMPRIGAADPDLAGLIVLAGSTRPLEDSILEQLDYIASLGTSLSAEKKKEMDRLRKQAAEVKALLRSGKAESPVLGAPAAYWLDLRDYHPAEAAKALRQPMLILQGERDYQVTRKDFALWKEALAGRANVTFKTYPRLNHLFMEGKGPSRPVEYDQAGHVAATVLDDLTEWIRRK